MNKSAAAATLAAGGAALLLTGLLAATGRLRRNHLIGLRTRATMRDDATWAAAHRAIGPGLAAGGAAWLATAAPLAASSPGPTTPNRVLAAALGLQLAWLLLLALRGQRAATAAGGP